MSTIPLFNRYAEKEKRSHCNKIRTVVVANIFKPRDYVMYKRMLSFYRRFPIRTVQKDRIKMSCSPGTTAAPICLLLLAKVSAISAQSNNGLVRCEYKCATDDVNAVMSSVSRWSALSMRPSMLLTL